MQELNIQRKVFRHAIFSLLSIECKDTHMSLRSSGTGMGTLWKEFREEGLLGLRGLMRSDVTISLYVASHAAYSIT